ncbi:MAG: carboxypeptidase-like regulatory domain-containing protein [Crocinitomicaceae bacterium]|nr:carboxypeptidase-like regulatory domain-containing protein [Crocinitomicaceae bacterium]
MSRVITLLTITILLGLKGFSQGRIIGVVKDSISGETIPFAKVKVEGQNNGANTDFDGAYAIKVNSGSYVLIFSMSNEGYEDIKRDVVVEKGQTIEVNVNLIKSSSVINLKEATVTHTKTEGANTIEGDDERRNIAAGATDGMTKEQMQNSGASTAVEAAAMVPGLSVEDGKSVYVRGLGDRYTKTILNGMEIPGLDPDRNSVQMDIFPATVIDNITVYKTFTPNLSGDFTGGLVDITTKDFPATEIFYAKASLGYNSAATFNKNYISYQGGKLDFLGFDDGSRALPIRTTDQFLDPSVGDPSLTQMTSAFGKTMATEKAKNFLDQNYSVNYGNRYSKEMKNKDKLNYGFNVVLNYRNSHRFFEEVEFNEYRKDPELSETRLFRDRSSKGSLSQHNVMWTALIGQSVKIRKSKLSLTLLHTQNGQSSASDLTQLNSEFNPSTLVNQSLMYTQRSVSNANLSGRHLVGKKSKLKIDWKLSPTLSMINDPDIRSTILEKDTTATGEDLFLLTESVGAGIKRTFRDLTEYNLSGRLDFTYKFNVWDSMESKLSFGALNTYKKRSFEVYDYIFRFKNNNSINNQIVLTDDPNWYFQDENIWNPQVNTGLYGAGERELANSFEASQNVTAAYVMNELPLTKSFRATYGVRVEHATNNYTGRKTDGSVIYTNERVLDNWNLLPSVNLVYKIKKAKTDSTYKRSTNIRAAYSQTVARPSFKEKSISSIYDPIQGRTYNGNIDLLQTSIHNADLRYEFFFGRTELFSVSAFYKHFIDPIEIVANYAAPSNVQPINAGVADVLGAEVEIRKAIGFEDKNHISLVAGTNFTYVFSRIDMNKVNMKVENTIYTEKEVRELNARDGETIGDYRPMSGQSPYIINAFLTFKNDSLGLTLNASYNVQGKKLAVIGVGSIPDVYEKPFHSLNLKVSKAFGEERQWKASISAKNLLLSKRSKVYESFDATPQIYELFNQGVQVTGSISYLFKGKKK